MNYKRDEKFSMDKIKTALVTATIAIASTAAHSETIRITCGKQSIAILADEKRLKIDGAPEEITDWSYDGVWLRVTRQSGELIGFNSENGYIILNGQAREASCKFQDPARLALLPLSDGALLRRAFVALAQQDRERIQQILTSRGTYTGSVDGLWGQGTEIAILQLTSQDSTLGDPKSEEGARSIVSSLLSDATAIEGEPIDGIGESITEPDAPVKIVSSVKFSGCGSKPFNDVAFHQENGRKFDTFSYLQRIEEAGAQLGSPNGRNAETTLQAAIRDYRHPTAAALLGSFRYQEGRNTESFDLFTVAAEGGDADSSYFVGLILGGLDEKVSDVAPRDIESAYQCLEFAATQGQVSALAVLSGAYAHSNSIPSFFYESRPRDYELALRFISSYLEKAPENDDQMSAVKSLKLEAEAEMRAEKEGARAALMLEAKERAKALTSKCVNQTTMLGLCWQLSVEEMKISLQARGFDDLTSSGSSGSVTLGRNGKDEVSIYSDRISFSCSAFDACDAGIDKVFSELMESKKLIDIEPKSQEQNLPGVGSTFADGICGNTPNGEQLCVINIVGSGLFGVAGNQMDILFSKGRLGKGQISFD